MLLIAEKEAPASVSFMDTLARGIPRAYAILFFSANTRLGWWLLAVSLITPAIGLSGLAAVIAATALGWVLGYERANLRNGFMLFNPLLVGLTVGWLHQCYVFETPVFALLWSASVTGGFFVSVMMQAWVGWHFGVSAHSLPSVAVTYALYLAGHHLFGAPLPPPVPPAAWLDFPFQAFDLSFSKGLFQSFGSILYQSHALPGILVFAGLALTSPLTTLVASAAFGAAMLALQTLGMGPQSVFLVGDFNFILCGIALGASYYITSAASLLLAMTGAVFTALTGVAIASALRYFDLPSSALPYNLVLLIMLYALRQRVRASGLVPSPAPGILPESAARQVLIQNKRFPDLHQAALHLPFDAPRIITQGFAGKLTHRGKWQHALDFEAEENGERHSGPGNELGDFHIYDTPVRSPCAGVVAYVENKVPDNAPGQNNPDRNWGNCIIIYADAGWYVLLAHFKQDGVTVTTGQRLQRGQLLGYCGNSGRSPVPHLHLNIQATGFLGVPTLPFCLKHYIEDSPAEGALFHTSGVPEAGATVRPSTPNPAMSEALAGWLPGEYRYRVTGENGRIHEETLRLDFDEQGRYRLRSRRFGSQLTAFINDGAFYCTDFSGSGHSLLALIATGLARVPCISDVGVRWHDHVSSVPFYAAPGRWMRDLTEPFFGPFLMRYRYRFESDPDGFVIVAEHTEPDGPRHSPREVVCGLKARRGIIRLEARMHNDRTLKAELIDYQPAKS